MLDKTPYSDETLVPIENPTIEGDIFSYQVGKTLYKMDCSTMGGAIDLALLVQKLKNETILLMRILKLFWKKEILVLVLVISIEGY